VAQPSWNPVRSNLTIVIPPNLLPPGGIGGIPYDDSGNGVWKKIVIVLALAVLVLHGYPALP